MAFDTYIKLDTITGESADSKLSGHMEAFSFSLGASNPVTIGSGTTGGGGGRAVLNSLSFTKKTDSASAPLFQACCTGTHLATGTVTLRKAGAATTGSPQMPYLVYGLKVIYVDSIQWSGSTGGDDSPTEHVSLTFGTLTVDYTPQTNTGAPGATIHGGWSVQTNATA